MSQLDLHLAQSVAAERHRTVVRDADRRRLARERSSEAAGPGRPGLLARAFARLHHPVQAPAAG
jgi:hypothetical protein